MYDGTPTPSERKTARAISIAFLPPIVGVPLHLILSLICDDWEGYVFTAGTTILFNSVLVMAVTLFYSKRTGNEDGDIVRKEDRLVPLLVGVLLYSICFAILWAGDAPPVITVLEASYAVTTASIAVISTRWKISIHACGMMGPSLAMCIAFGPVGLVGFAFVPLIAWSRYIQRKHTAAQLAAGAILGLTVTAALYALMIWGPSAIL